MKKLSIFLVWVAMLSSLIYWSATIEGTVSAGKVNTSTIVNRSESSNGNSYNYYTFAYTDAKTGKVKYVKNKYMNYHTEGMLKKGIYIKSNGGEITGLVLCWVGFVIFSICYLIAIFCGIEETRNGEYKCGSRCPLNGFCNYMHYKGDFDNSKSSNSFWNNFWGIRNSLDTNTK